MLRHARVARSAYRHSRRAELRVGVARPSSSMVGDKEAPYATAAGVSGGQALFSVISEIPKRIEENANVFDESLAARSSFSVVDDNLADPFSGPTAAPSGPTRLPPGSEDGGTMSKASGLHLRQIQMEEEQMAEALVKFTDLRDEMARMGKSSKFKKIQRIFLNWYEPFLAEIQQETTLVKRNIKGKDRLQYGPYLLMLPPQLLCVITLDTVVNIILTNGNKPTPIIKLAKEIGHWIESEVNILKAKSGVGEDKVDWWMVDEIKRAQQKGSSKLTANLLKRIRKSLAVDAWEESTKVKVGGAMIALLMKSAKDVDGDPAFLHSSFYSVYHRKNVGSLCLDPLIFEEMEKISDQGLVTVRHLPMLVPPKQWASKRRAGGYFRLPSALMRTTSAVHKETTRRADMLEVLAGLDYLGRIPWAINADIYEVIKTLWQTKESIGELPSQENIPLPNKEDFFFVPKVKNLDAVLNGDMENVSGGQEMVNIDDFFGGSPEQLADLEKELEPEFHENMYRDMCARVKQKNSEMHSLRCDTRIKLMIAEKFLDDRFFFPYNLDFRGRAYPIPPNLNHIGSDFSRALLLFAEGKPLGVRGFHWMKVHLATLFGNNKQSHLERAAWVDEHLEHVLESARDPLHGERWWVGAEEPFQALATCMEIRDAIESGDPTTFVSRLPVHQDGSCNGLQHYAALGRDEKGGAAVNLQPADKPQDVYSGVLEIVLRKVDEDAAAELPEHADDAAVMKLRAARMIQGHVDRKVIKQTVMTSVYGVTMIGARSQVEARLREKLLPDANAITTKEYEREIFEASMYLANCTLDSLGEMFSNAKDIMDWLGQCAAVVASTGHAMSWITPLGLPVVQPYRRHKRHVVKTLLQTVTLSVDSDALPVAVSKQKTAFPPNFVHSLDASHMLMTSLKMQELNLSYASVHDSYWTHACDVPIMNEVLREAFVELYEQPILETLKESIEVRYPGVKFPEIPKRGSLDLNDVKESKYFFH